MLPASSALRAGSRLLQQLIRQQQQQQPEPRFVAVAAAAGSARPASSSASASTSAAAAEPATKPSPDTTPDLTPPFTRKQRMEALLRTLVQPVPSSAVNQGQLAEHLVNLSPERGARSHALLDPADALSSLLRALLAARAALREDGHVVIVGSSPNVAPIVRAAAASCLSPNVWFMAEGWRPGALTNHRAHRRLFRPDLHQPARRALREWGLLPANPHVVQHHQEGAAGAGAAAGGGAGDGTTTATTATAAVGAPCAVGLAAAPPPSRLSWRDKWQLYARTREPGTRALLEALIAREDAAHALAAPGRPRGGLLPKLRLLVVLDPTRNGIALKEAAARGVPTAALVAHNVDLADVTYPILGRDASPRMAWLFLDRLVKVANVGV